MKDLSQYKQLNKAYLYREFKEKYNYPNMQITSYRRVLYGESTYLGKGRSPYIADMFKFFSEKLDKPFIDIAYDLLDSEFFGRKNTLLDVLIAETGMSKNQITQALEHDQVALDNLCDLNSLRLCELNDYTKVIYKEMKNKLIEKR